jgi:tetratricopeptide (TPR) repeat protein
MSTEQSPIPVAAPSESPVLAGDTIAAQPQLYVGYCNETEETSAPDLAYLREIDEQSAVLQRQGNYTEALECMEKGLVLRQHFFGSDSDEVWTACRSVGELCNLLAMTYLGQGDFSTVLELLKKAEILTEREPVGRAVTLNNFACYHRKKGNLSGAVKCLSKALKIESRLENIPNRADTHLNMCAVLSQLGKHQSALEQAQSSLILLHEELFAGHREGDSEPSGDRVDRMAVLAIAYHNVGVEYEFLKNFPLSLQSYHKGMDMAQQYLGASHSMVITLKNSYLSAKRRNDEAEAVRKAKKHPSRGRKKIGK